MKRVDSRGGTASVWRPPRSLAGGKGTVTGAYVEARTAEVFTGGCIMNSEAETVGKQAVLAWKVDRGSFNGIAHRRPLGRRGDVGRPQPGHDRKWAATKPAVRSALFVDQRANPAQQLALVAMANELSNGLVGTIVQVTPTPIQFADHGSEINVSAGQVVARRQQAPDHDPTCGAMQWFHPLASIDDAAMGVAAQHLFTGSALGTKWSDPNKRSAFFGTFSY